MYPIGRVMSVVGRAADRVGLWIQGRNSFAERLRPSTRVVPIKNAELSHGYQAFVASSASVVGDVTLDEMSSVWYGATVRGDGGAVRVGSRSAVQDNAVVCGVAGQGVEIGDDVVIGFNSRVTGCSVESGATVGFGATVGAGATVGQDAYVDAGSSVPPGAVVGRAELWTGNPARRLRTLSEPEISIMRSTALMYAEQAQRHREQDSKSTLERTLQLDTHMDDFAFKYCSDLRLEVDRDVVAYYKLSQEPEDSAVFRRREYDEEKMEAERVATEDDHQRQEDAYYSHLATLNRVGQAVKDLLDINPRHFESRDSVLHLLRYADEDALAFLRDLLARIAHCPPEENHKLLTELTALDPHAGSWRGYDALREFTRLKEHALAMELDQAPPPEDADLGDAFLHPPAGDVGVKGFGVAEDSMR